MKKLDERIQNALENRKYIGDRIGEIESSQKSPAKNHNIPRFIIGISIAACVAIFIVLMPGRQQQISLLDEMGIERPSFELVRGAAVDNEEIESLMRKENYKSALPLISKAIAKDSTQFLNIEPLDEETLYEQEVLQQEIYQLQWFRIYSLIRLNLLDDAKEYLTEFVKEPGDHQEMASNLLERINHRFNR